VNFAVVLELVVEKEAGNAVTSYTPQRGVQRDVKSTRLLRV
jgi:hypothetical protein